MMNSVLVSVIIPVYNASSFIQETVLSVTAQSLNEIEIICVDDCSTDNSLEILHDLRSQDDRVVVFSMPENSGTGAAINAALDFASGDYIQILGNDDLLEADSLSELLCFSKENNLDICQYGIRLISDSPGTLECVKRLKVKEKYHRVQHDYPICSGLVLMKLASFNNEYRMSNGPQFVKKSFLDSNDIRNLIGLHHEDMYFTYKILIAAERAALIHSQYYVYRIRPSSLEASKQYRKYSPLQATSLLVSSAKMIEITPKKILYSPSFKFVRAREINRYLMQSANQYAFMDMEDRCMIVPQGSKVASLFISVLNIFIKKAGDTPKSRESYFKKHRRFILIVFYLRLLFQTK